ncbi:MAG: hypothetical protein H6710_04690 [Myxococcales bacterium]|nr:hypothetical protein [Myxococcales bacterium]MCB9705648.1 hypothetical protein [Myxococcales bacterium]
MVLAWSVLALALASPAVEPTFTPDLRPVAIPEQSSAASAQVVLVSQLRDPFAPTQGSARTLPPSLLKDPFRGETQARPEARSEARSGAPTKSALLDPFQVQRRSQPVELGEPLKDPFEASARPEAASAPRDPAPAPVSADAPAAPEAPPSPPASTDAS